MTCSVLEQLVQHYGVNAGVAAAVVLLVRQGGWPPSCFPLSAAQLARQLGCDRGKARRYIRDLISMAGISPVRRDQGCPNYFTLSPCLQKILESLLVCGASVASRHGVSNTSDRENSNSNTKSDPTSPIALSTTISRAASSDQPPPESATPAALGILRVCLPNIDWQGQVNRQHAQGVPQGWIQRGLRAAVAEVLTGHEVIRSWDRWFARVVRNPETVPDEKWARFIEWFVALEPLRARLERLGGPCDLDHAPCAREALALLLGADSGLSGAAWEEVVRTYGGRAVLQVLEQASVPPRPVALEFSLWEQFGADALVTIKSAELTELKACGVDVACPAPEAACG